LHSRSELVRLNPLSHSRFGLATSAPSKSTPSSCCSPATIVISISHLREPTLTLRLWVPTTPSNPRLRDLCGLAAAFDRSELPRPTLLVRESASLVSCWIVHGYHTLQRFLPTPAACHLWRAVLHAVSQSHLRSIAAAPRIRAVGADAFSIAGVVHTARGSLLSWSLFPPSRMTSRPSLTLLCGSSLGLLSCTELVEALCTCALQSFIEPEV
jgi:hypothetical protein